MDESAQHAGHAGARETDSPSGETHFRVALVSPEFEGLPTIKRHRLVYHVGRPPLSLEQALICEIAPTTLSGTGVGMRNCVGCSDEAVLVRNACLPEHQVR